MAYGTTLADGTTPIAPVMNRAQVLIGYRAFSPEIPQLVDQMLESPEDQIIAIHERIDTPALAVQCLAACIGSRLPVYEYDDAGNAVQTDETKQIEHADRFALAEGPTPNGSQEEGFTYTTVLQRVVAHEPVAEEAEPARKHPVVSFLLHAAASQR